MERRLSKGKAQGEDHPVMKHLPAFLDHANHCAELRLRRIGVLDRPLAELSGVSRARLVAEAYGGKLLGGLGWLVTAPLRLLPPWPRKKRLADTYPHDAHVPPVRPPPAPRPPRPPAQSPTRASRRSRSAQSDAGTPAQSSRSGLIDTSEVPNTSRVSSSSVIGCDMLVCTSIHRQCSLTSLRRTGSRAWLSSRPQLLPSTGRPSRAANHRFSNTWVTRIAALPADTPGRAGRIAL